MCLHVETGLAKKRVTGGEVAQLVERSVRNAEVEGSIPFFSMMA
jgi:hypothetical protein